MSEHVSFDSFVRQHSLALTRFAYLVCGDRQRAEDLVQESLLSLYRRFGRNLPLEDPINYVRKAVVNAHVSVRRKRSSSEVPADLVVERAVGAGTKEVDDRDQLWRRMLDLPERQRVALVMRYYVDAADDAIATVLGCERATVRSLVARALAALRSQADAESGRQGVENE